MLSNVAAFSNKKKIWAEAEPSRTLPSSARRVKSSRLEFDRVFNFKFETQLVNKHFDRLEYSRKTRIKSPNVDKNLKYDLFGSGSIQLNIKIINKILNIFVKIYFYNNKIKIK